MKHNPRLTVGTTPGAVEGLLAPELTHLTSASIVESKPADIFGFSMLGFELLTAEPPFNGQPPGRIALSISRGARPEFPQNAEDVGLTDQIRNLLRSCWHQNPMERPTIDEVVRTLERIEDNRCVQISSSGQNLHLSALLM